MQYYNKFETYKTFSKKSTLDYAKITKYISAPRLHKYEVVCSSNKQALKLYQANLRVSQAFYPLLSLLEVVLRNAIDHEFTTHFNDNNWLRNQRTGFMSHQSLTYNHWRTGNLITNNFLKEEVNKSIKKIRNGVSHSKIVADLKFGFWIALFDFTHYTILVGAPIRIFTNLPTGANRQLIDDKLTRIRDFRNRVYHNEPIIFRKDSAGNPHYDLSKAYEVYTDIQDIFSWLRLDFKTWTKRINNIEFELKRVDYVYSVYPSKKYYYFRIITGINHYKKKYLR